LGLTYTPRLDLIFEALTSESKFPFPGIRALSKDVAAQRTLRSNPHALERLLPVLGDIPTIFGEIRALTAMQDQFDTDKVPDASSIVAFGMKRSSVCHRLMSCSAPVKQMGDNYAPHALFEPCKIAALISMEYLLAGSCPRAEILQSLESKLTRSTQSVSVGSRALVSVSTAVSCWFHRTLLYLAHFQLLSFLVFN
jgi:hypothetical protein